jgi:dephospho-CoA kinase
VTPEKLALILTRQISDAEKRQRADYIIENDGTLDDQRTRAAAALERVLTGQKPSAAG